MSWLIRNAAVVFLSVCLLWAGLPALLDAVGVSGVRALVPETVASWRAFCVAGAAFCAVAALAAQRVPQGRITGLLTAIAGAVAIACVGYLVVFALFASTRCTDPVLPSSRA